MLSFQGCKYVLNIYWHTFFRTAKFRYNNLGVFGWLQEKSIHQYMAAWKSGIALPVVLPRCSAHQQDINPYIYVFFTKKFNSSSHEDYIAATTFQLSKKQLSAICVLSGHLHFFNLQSIEKESKPFVNYISGHKRKIKIRKKQPQMNNNK